MPFPTNWLEELVIEWLDLDGFAISTSIGVPAGPGGKWSPDVVGAKRIDAKNRLVIRRCEATMWLIQGPDDTKKKFREKFSETVENAVRQHFIPVFGEQAVQQAEYQKWVITFQASNSVRRALEGLDEEVPQPLAPGLPPWRRSSGSRSRPPRPRAKGRGCSECRGRAHRPHHGECRLSDHLNCTIARGSGPPRSRACGAGAGARRLPGAETSEAGTE